MSTRVRGAVQAVEQCLTQCVSRLIGVLVVCMMLEVACVWFGWGMAMLLGCVLFLTGVGSLALGLEMSRKLLRMALEDDATHE